MNLFLSEITIFIILIIPFNSVLSKKIVSTFNQYNYSTKRLNKSQCIILNNKMKEFCNYENEIKHESNTNTVSELEFLKDKKIITISPGGYKGFYELGVLSYIKEHYDLSKYVFSGASAGSWNALFATYKGNTHELFDIIDIKNFKKKVSLHEVQNTLKIRILDKLKTSDFELEKLFIGVTSFNKEKLFHTNIFSDFIDLEDAINCCIASSHIPLITGGLLHFYHGMYAFDGGFSTYPYIDILQSALHITPDIWIKENERPSGLYKILELLTIFNSDFDFYKLYKEGYDETSSNFHVLDWI